MKKMLRFMSVVLVAACLALGVVGCGGDSPKGLAQQAYDLVKKEGNAAMTSEKGLKITAKVAALSEEEQKIYMAEYMRIAKEGK